MKDRSQEAAGGFVLKKQDEGQNSGSGSEICP
ncbi:hypothetical protein QFZ31_003993 [Neobacillus niacini]|nr:hypothetical protein [Neobacillus niacini]